MTKKGSEYERELIHKLNNIGYEAIRIPASGGGTSRNLPDILCGDGNNYIAIQCKKVKQLPVYFPEYEAKNLLSFSSKFGAIPLLGIRIVRREWMFFDLSELPITKSGNHRVDERIFERGIKLEELKEL